MTYTYMVYHVAAVFAVLISVYAQRKMRENGRRRRKREYNLSQQ